LLASPLRRLLQDPGAILSPYVHDGMTVLEPGPGMGFFTLELARLVGPSGRVVAIDIQPKMLEVLWRRLAKRGLAECVETRVVEAGSMGLGDLAGSFDFALAFAMVHELPSAASFFAEVAAALKTGGSVLLAEPRGHVGPELFDEELKHATAAGLVVRSRPAITRSHAAILVKDEG